MVVTVAFRTPAIGLVDIETVNEVGVASVTVPTAPPLSKTVLLAAVVSKPEPAIVSVVRLAARLVVAAVTTGRKAATCTAAPLETPLEVTTAVSAPADGAVVIVTVNDVAVAEVTFPAAPLLKTTVLLAAVGSNPNPVIVTVEAFKATLVVVAVTTGLTSAT